MAALVWLHGAGGSGNVSQTLGDPRGRIRHHRPGAPNRGAGRGARFSATGIRSRVPSSSRCCRSRRGAPWIASASGSAGSPTARRCRSRLGISYGNIFRRVYAGSPGLMQPIAANRQAAHLHLARAFDPTMPIDDTSRQFVPRLKRLSYDVTYREYDGGISCRPRSLREVIVWMTK